MFKSVKKSNFIFSMIVILFTSCTNQICDNSILSELASPNKEYVVTLFERNCGATTPFITILSIRENGEDFEPENFDNWVFTLHEKSTVNVRWKNGTKLHVDFNAYKDNPTMIKNWKNVEISFSRI